MAIAILGWGSLLWLGYLSSDPDEAKRQTDFHQTHDEWKPGGPWLRIEFSRISFSRLGALTLVTDEAAGAWNQTSWCLSRRTNWQDAIDDLCVRENLPSHRRIGRWPADANWKCANPSAFARIEAWAKQNRLDNVVWTDLSSNFTDSISAQLKGERPEISSNHTQLFALANQPFSVPNALAYLRTLSGDSRRKALEYIARTPPSVQTPLRDAMTAMAMERAL